MEIIIDGIVYVPKENKSEIEYPIFKRNKDGEVFRFEDSSSYPLAVISNYRIDKYTSDNHNDWSTTPYDKEKGLYHLQPVWYWSYQFAEGNIIRTIAFFDVINNAYIIGSRTVPYEHSPYEGFHIITPEQLKVMPFVWEMYQQVLKDNKIF